MTGLLPKSHRIIEKGLMEFRPFGQERDGQRIQDVSGVIVRANLDYLKDLVTRSRGREAGDSVIDELVDLLNARISDREFHVTRAFLKNHWNSYSYEFVMYVNEFCALLSGDDQFAFHVGREKFLSPIIQLLGRPLSIKQIYQLYPYFIGKFTKGALLPEVVSVTNGMAVMRLRFSDRTIQQFGPYLLSCADKICQTTKATIAEVPSQMFGLRSAVVQEHCCMAGGADYCEWTFTWQPQERQLWGWMAVGSIFGLAALASVQVWNPAISLWLKIWIGIIPVIMFFLAGKLWMDRQELNLYRRASREQLDAVELQHEELKKAYQIQEQSVEELQKRITELTMIHDIGLTLSLTREREQIIQVALGAIISDLPYERALFLEYDSHRSVAYGGRLVGGAPELAEAVKSFEIPVVDWSHEGTVFKKGKSLLIEDAEETYPGFHPLHQHLMAQLQTQSFVAVPVKIQQRVIGALVADRLEPRKFSTQDVNLLATVASQLAIALDNANAYGEIEDLNIGLEAKVKARTSDLETLNQALEQANVQLQEVDSLKSAFISHCSHELRTPLTSMKGFVENLLQGVVGETLSDRQILYLERLKANTNRLTRMIADLLDLSRIESRTLRMRLVPVKLLPIIHEVVEQFQLVTKQKSLQVFVSSFDSEMTLLGDGDRINQIVTNLIHNAIKYTPEKGTIRVDVRAESDRHVRLIVSDSGCGIPPEAIPQLFSSFYQAQAGQDCQQDGLGLGLAIVKTLVDLHGGQITVQSDIGKGATFTVLLPQYQRD